MLDRTKASQELSKIARQYLAPNDDGDIQIEEFQIRQMLLELRDHFDRAVEQAFHDGASYTVAHVLSAVREVEEGVGAFDKLGQVVDNHKSKSAQCSHPRYKHTGFCTEPICSNWAGDLKNAKMEGVQVGNNNVMSNVF